MQWVRKAPAKDNPVIAPDGRNLHIKQRHDACKILPIRSGRPIVIDAARASGAPPSRAQPADGIANEQNDLEARRAGRSRRLALAGGLRGMVADGGTGLYDTTLAAVRAVQRNWVPGRINTVVLLTDGKNEKDGGLSLPSLLTALQATGDRPVRIITIAYGADADQGVLRKIAAATQGASYVAADPKEIQRIFILAISNF